MYLRRFYLGGEAFAHEEVVYAPTHIARTGIGKVGPQCVVAATFDKKTECVDESRTDDRIDALTLFFCETVLALIGLWVRKIFRCMRYIEVPAENNGLFLFKLFAEGEKCRVPVLVAESEAT